MNPARLDQRISLVLPTSSSISRYGETILTTTTASIWAQVKEASGNVSNVNGVITTDVVYDFLVRYRSDITENSELIYNNRTFDVGFIEPMYGRSNYLRIVGKRR
jgi:SPP1 family predicted phage head-tail adaptor